MRSVTYLALALLLAACTDGTPPTPASALDKLAGRQVVINYWAIWCKPCIKEIPELNQLALEYPDIAVLGVNYDGLQGDELKQQLQQLDIQFPMLDNDPSAELGIDRPAVLPTTIILDPDGQVSQVLVGPQTLDSLARAAGQAAPADNNQ